MNCLKCEWHTKEGACAKAENALSQMDDIRCLLKVQVILMRDMLGELQYMNEVEEE